MAEIRYVSKVGRDAWLRVKLDGAGEISLPQNLKVQWLKTDSGRDTFSILEGPFKGKKGSVSRPTAGSYLVTGVKHLPGGAVKFDVAKQSLWFDNKGPFNAFSGAFDSYTKVSPGVYDLAIPDAPHAATRNAYYTYTDYHKTWFRIGTSLAGSRYLHVGEISEGCVTVRAFLWATSSTPPEGFSDLPEKAQSMPGGLGIPYPAHPAPLASWTDLYQYLIIRRKDDQSVGTLTVV